MRTPRANNLALWGQFPALFSSSSVPNRRLLRISSKSGDESFHNSELCDDNGMDFQFFTAENLNNENISHPYQLCAIGITRSAAHIASTYIH